MATPTDPSKSTAIQLISPPAGWVESALIVDVPAHEDDHDKHKDATGYRVEETGGSQHPNQERDGRVETGNDDAERRVTHACWVSDEELDSSNVVKRLHVAKVQHTH
eukprot:CAMPEP_0115512736 /NCGR_PEP_ID=MMETSP0271-20121206/74680_1 /TAXON_ID=71861 /ORGANISM="Scrippsiella trochoidea, Strain CCMP3099" /LENGTH=106 /DNA_ID=CAMNT_0002942937 /DNA_START=23 /DNA_END=344 /DNA_ORIENTATION=+